MLDYKRKTICSSQWNKKFFDKTNSDSLLANSADFLSLLKRIYEKLELTLYLVVKDAFFLKSETGQDHPFSLQLLNVVLEGIFRALRQEKGIQLGANKIVCE